MSEVTAETLAAAQPAEVAEGDALNGNGAAPAAPEDLGRSLVDRIRDRNSSRQRVLDRPIPFWDGEVVVRYGPVSSKMLLEATKRRGPAVDAELLARACREILLRDVDGDGELHPAREGDGGEAPIRFDGRLADLFKIDALESRKIVYAMYQDNIAISADAQRLIDWQTGENLDSASPEDIEEMLQEDAEGERPAAT